MKISYIYILLVTLALGSCVKDRVSTGSSGPTNIGSRSLIHYWSFNKTSDTAAMRHADSTVGGGVFDYVAGYIDTVHPGTLLNARNGADSGGAVRVRNPYTSMTIHVPTTGYKQPVLTMAIEKSSSGPSANNVMYTTDGTNYFTAPTSTVIFSTTWSLVSCDFSSIAGADDNANFAIKLVPTSGNTGTSGNDRFDNITIDAYPK